MRLATLAVLAAMVAGCSTHSVWNLSDRMEVKPFASAPAHSREVFVTQDGLRPGTYERIAQIDLSRTHCEGDRKVMAVFADKARELGCDAVLEVDIWRKKSGVCGNSPHANGQCVKLQDTTLVDGLEGFWL